PAGGHRFAPDHHHQRRRAVHRPGRFRLGSRRVRLIRPASGKEGIMAEQAAKKTAKRAGGEASGTFTDEEKAAAKERVREMRRSPRASKADGERDVLEKISEMDDTDRVMAERIHAIVTASAPDLAPRTWYGMPAYAKDGTIVCHFQP